jgi:hypothetical protein
MICEDSGVMEQVLISRRNGDGTWEGGGGGYSTYCDQEKEGAMIEG